MSVVVLFVAIVSGHHAGVFFDSQSTKASFQTRSQYLRDVLVYFSAGLALSVSNTVSHAVGD